MIVRNIHRGFTLIEMLIALTILSMVVGMTFGSLRLAGAVARSVDAQITRAQNIHHVQRLLRDQLRHAIPVIDPDKFDSEILDFNATDHEVSFIAPITVGGKLPGLYRMSLKVSRNMDHYPVTNRLVLTFELRTPEHRSGRFDSEVTELTLIEDFLGARFAYFDNTRSGAERWVDEWRDRQSLPRLIRLRIDGVFGDDDSWPELIIPLRLSPMSVLSDS